MGQHSSESAECGIKWSENWDIGMRYWKKMEDKKNGLDKVKKKGGVGKG